MPQTRPRSNTLPKSFGSSLGHEDSESDGEPRAIQKEKTPSKEATLELITKRLKENRAERHLPEDVKVILSHSLCLGWLLEHRKQLNQHRLRARYPDFFYPSDLQLQNMLLNLEY